MTDDRTLEQLAAEVMVIQDACNLSGVVHAFSRSISRLRALLPQASTDAINNHPICVMFASKISSLTSLDTAFGQAYDECDGLMIGLNGREITKSMSIFQEVS